MNKPILILLILFTNYSFSQTINDYKAVIIPLKYDFQKSDNQYRLQTITKVNLKKAGFQAFYANEIIPAEITDRCSLLYIDVKKDDAFMMTKLFITFKDCYGTEVYTSPIGKSREKDFEAAYLEALNLAFVNVYSLNYMYNGNGDFSIKAGMNNQSVPVTAAPIIGTTKSAISAVAAAIPTTTKEAAVIDEKSIVLLYAQPSSYGYQLIDSEPKVVMKVYKTSNAKSYIAIKGIVQGVLVAQDNQWFFEYYQNDKLISEKIGVKF